jgi:dTDP-4-dehydrorhamnose reductase
MRASPLPDPVLVTGAGGQLGRALLATVPEGVAVRGLTRAALDICDEGSVADCLDRDRPQLLINAAAYTAVDRAEDEPAAARRINTDAPRLMARLCAERGIRLLHVSTDFVFDGEQGHPYAPDAPARPLGVYGASKLAGETALREAGGNTLIVRTGWVYSAGSGNFLNTMLRLHRARDELRVVADQVGTPTAALSLARALWAAAARPALAGVYHYSDAGVCSWYDFAVAIGEEAQAAGLLAAPARVLPITTADYPTPARRPAFSVLDKTATWRDFDLEPRHWRAWLRATVADIAAPEPASSDEEQATETGAHG